MSTVRAIAFGILIGMMAAPASVGKVYLRWTYSAVPPIKVLGVNELVVEWTAGAKSFVAAAKKQGYWVYLETTSEQAAAAAEAGEKAGAAGIVLTDELTKQSEAEESARKLRKAHAKLKILVLYAGGKPPELRGWLVFKKNGILQVSSPTSQPWLDANLALIRYEEAGQKSQRPLYTFSWDLTDPLVKEQGPSPADYKLAITEAGAFHADLILEVHEKLQKGLASGDKAALADWGAVRQAIEFYQRREGRTIDAAARVAVMTDEYEATYEALNLMARHNIPYRVLHSAEVKDRGLDGFDVVISFAELGKDLAEAVRSFAEKGGVAVLVNLRGPYPWESAATAKTTGHSATYEVGKGRVIELGEAVRDPETFAQDIRRLMVKAQVPVSLWNSLTTLVVAYPGGKPGETVVELVNYAGQSTQVQVQAKGKYGTARYESPEKGCCETLKASVVNGHTEFVVTDVVIGGRVHLIEAGGGRN
jgi:hypothetical protein